MVDFLGCAAVRFGAPNDEAMPGHPLHGRGRVPYEGHEVHDSAWLAEHVRIDSAHPYHSDEAWRRYHHYLLAFHDETSEALAERVSARLVRSTLPALLHRAVTDLPNEP